MNLNVCGDFRHDEIVYDGQRCPLCGALEEIDHLKDIVADLEAQ